MRLAFFPLDAPWCRDGRAERFKRFGLIRLCAYGGVHLSTTFFFKKLVPSPRGAAPEVGHRPVPRKSAGSTPSQDTARRGRSRGEAWRRQPIGVSLSPSARPSSL